MKKEFKKLLRPAVFTLGGALAGLGYYALVGCSTGSCAITASPVNTMLYMGLMGWLLSGIFGSQKSVTRRHSPSQRRLLRLATQET